MNPMHVHLALNHLPLAGALFGAALLQWGAFRRDVSFQRAGLALLAAAAAFAVPTFLTGEGAEHALEKLVPLGEGLIHPHEEAGELAVWAIGATGAFSAWVLWRYRGRPELPGRWVALASFGGVVCFAALAWTSYLGGRIRHSELDAVPGGAQRQEGVEQVH